MRKTIEYVRVTLAAVLSLTLLICAHAGFALAQETAGQEHSGHQHEMAMTPDDDAMQVKMLADRQESEFNHHLAGFLVVLAGIFILFQGGFANRWPALRYAWPACFLASGIFLLVWSDAELWPLGDTAWSTALRSDPEVLQHKIYAALLLALGAIEWQRARGALTATWSAWVFPSLAIAGSVLLLFHEHQGGMHGPDHVKLMARIQSQHLHFSLAGIGVGLTKGLSDVETRWQGVFRTLWPSLMILLGIMLMFYRE